MSDHDVRAPRAPGSRRIAAASWDAMAEIKRLRAEAADAARAELEAARVEAERLRREGLAAGREEGLASATEQLARAALARARLVAGLEEELVDAAVEVARRIVERAAHVDREVVLELALRALEPVRGRAEVVLHAHPDDVACLREAEPRLCEALAEGRGLPIVADHALARGEVRIESEWGAIDARLEPQLEALGRALRAELDGGW
jgi:flagellar biosynthesis/type III secretory pathway protein FliH